MKRQETQTTATIRSSSAWLTASLMLVLLLIALPLRVLNLADFATTDEVYHWIGRVERFSYAIANQRWSETNQTGHPGVTVMWLGSLGLALERAFVGYGSSTIEHLAWLKLPAAILQSLIVPLVYWLLRKLFVPSIAFMAALLWATAPYLVAHARVLHLDALLTSFVTLAILLLLIATQTQRTKQRVAALLASGACMGLALLTKGPSLITLPIAGLLMWALWPSQTPLSQTSGPQRIWQWFWRQLRAAVPLYLLWLLVALLVVFICWPALWTDTGRVLNSYIEEITANGGRPNGDGQFFLGKPDADPGFWFYPIANLFRMTPISLVGWICLPFVAFAAYRKRQQIPAWSQMSRVALALLAFIAFWTLIMTMGPKKFDRYVLPTWPAIEILAAIGLVGALHALGAWFGKQGPRIAVALGSLVCALALLLNAKHYHSYYLSYYNQALGGGPAAERSLLIGWGEGMNEVGAWLEQQPDLQYGPVLSALRATLQPFVSVTVRDIEDYGKIPANYAVVYLESVQRGALPEIYQAIQAQIPVHSINIHGIEYAKIYQLPRPFAQPIEAAWADALSLHGFTLAIEDQMLWLTPAWDVRAQPEHDYQVFVHVLDANGQKVAQVDVPPGGGDYPPTSAWQAGRQIAVPLPVALPDLPSGEYQVVMGMYQLDSFARAPLTRGPALDPAINGPDVLILDSITIP
jgi:4-amino-4-deoxy-L-arabinose transferase-like glycosyltransferase